MISFVWPDNGPMLAGTGGSETYTAGHVRELTRRGVKAQVVTVGLGEKDGRKDFPDIPFLGLKSMEEISDLTGTVVFVNASYPVKTRNKSALILHCIVDAPDIRAKRQLEIIDKTVIATSIYSGQQWALYLDIPSSRIKIVLPFADPLFGNTKRSKPTKKTRILFAGRLHTHKGIYTMLEMMHDYRMRNNGYSTSIVLAGLHEPIGRTIAQMLQNYPFAHIIPARKTTSSMAQLLAQSDILLMPSVFAEPFGMLSVEAQHAGCRVVASNVGGLPETNCGLLTLIEPRDPAALLHGIEQAVALGQVTKKEREHAADLFTLGTSVDGMLKALSL